MKHITLLLSLLLLFAVGCKSADSLSRKPRKKAPVKTQQKAVRKRNSNDEDKLFNTIFKRDPQKFEGDSKLSQREQELLRQSNISNDPMVKKLHQKGRSDRNRSSDWVFGTKNGSYF